jgi:hypothetical protein
MILELLMLAKFQQPMCDAPNEKAALAFIQQNYGETVVWMGQDPEDASRVVVTQGEEGTWSLILEPKGPNDTVCLFAEGNNGPKV